MSATKFRPGGLLLLAVLVTACGEPGRATDGSSAAPGSPHGEWSTAGCGLARPPHFTTMGGARVPVTPPALGAAMARIDTGGRAEFAASYAGLEVDQQRVRAIVYRVPSRAFDDFVRVSAEDSCVVVRDAAHALETLAQLQQRITADLAVWADRGIHITTVTARHDGAGVEVGTADVESARRQLPEHYGPQAPLVFVEQGPVRPLPAPGPATAPQAGG